MPSGEGGRGRRAARRARPRMKCRQAYDGSRGMDAAGSAPICRPSPRDRLKQRGQGIAPDVPPARRVGAQRGEVAVAEPAATRARVNDGSPVPGLGRERARRRAAPPQQRRCTGSTSQNTAARRARTSTRSSSSNATPSRGRAA